MGILPTNKFPLWKTGDQVILVSYCDQERDNYVKDEHLIQDPVLSCVSTHGQSDDVILYLLLC